MHVVISFPLPLKTLHFLLPPIHDQLSINQFVVTLLISRVADPQTTSLSLQVLLVHGATMRHENDPWLMRPALCSCCCCQEQGRSWAVHQRTRRQQQRRRRSSRCSRREVHDSCHDVVRLKDEGSRSRDLVFRTRTNHQQRCVQWKRELWRQWPLPSLSSIQWDQEHLHELLTYKELMKIQIFDSLKDQA